MYCNIYDFITKQPSQQLAEYYRGRLDEMIAFALRSELLVEGKNSYWGNSSLTQQEFDQRVDEVRQQSLSECDGDLVACRLILDEVLLYAKSELPR